jgi:AcrR family transcriptional regulator
MPRQEERRERARRRLLDAALSVFSERGYSESGLEEVAQRAGASRTLVYHHFGSKEGLLMALHQELDEALLARVQAAVKPDQPPLENLVQGATAFLRASADLPMARIILLDTPGVPGLREHVEEGQREWALLIEREIKRGIDEGSIAPVDPGMTARVLLGALQEATLAAMSDVAPREASRRAQESVTRIIEGLAVARWDISGHST